MESGLRKSDIFYQPKVIPGTGAKKWLERRRLRASSAADELHRFMPDEDGYCLVCGWKNGESCSVNYEESDV